MNQTLYEIDSRLASLLDFDEYAVDQETGEIVSLEEVERLQMDRAEKIEGWGCWIKNRNADIAALKAEIDNLTKRKRLIENQVEASKNRLKDYLAGEKIKTAKVVISYTRSKAVEDINLDILPLEYKKVEVSADKMAIKRDLSNGIEVPGARLAEHISMTVR